MVEVIGCRTCPGRKGDLRPELLALWWLSLLPTLSMLFDLDFRPPLARSDSVMLLQSSNVLSRLAFGRLHRLPFDDLFERVAVAVGVKRSMVSFCISSAFAAATIIALGGGGVIWSKYCGLSHSPRNASTRIFAFR